MVCLTVIYLRISNPDMPRPFRTPFFPFTPILGALMCLVLLMSLMAGAATRNFFLIYLGVGFVIYFLYGMWNSKLAKGETVLGHEPDPMGCRIPNRGREPARMTDQVGPAGAPILPAATILLLRDEPAFEVLMVQRHHQIDFAAGALVFPGGKSRASDHAPGWQTRAIGWQATVPEQRGLRIAAIREAFRKRRGYCSPVTVTVRRSGKRACRGRP